MVTKNSEDNGARTHQILHSCGQICKPHRVKLLHPKPSRETQDGKQERPFPSLMPYTTEVFCQSCFLIKYGILGSSDKTVLLHGLQRLESTEERYFHCYFFGALFLTSFHTLLKLRGYIYYITTSTLIPFYIC